jgi:hypothetical protein
MSKLFSSRSIRHWNFRYLRNRFNLYFYEKNHAGYPWLTQQANMILASWLKKTDVGIEWGSGRSTVWFAKRVAKLTSVEHDAKWYNKVKTLLSEEKISNVNLHLYETPKIVDEKNNPYVDIVDDFPDNSLDFALVDDSFRSECAFKVLKKLKVGGILIIDNINLYLPSNTHSPCSRNDKTGPLSEQWVELANILSTWRRIWTSNGVFDTAIWIKPPS